MTSLSIALASSLLVALQIVWMQALGYAQGHHLAYGVISIALLGFGAGGSVLTLWPRRSGRPMESLYAPALLLCAVATAWLPLLAHPLLSGLEVDLLYADCGQWFRLAGLGGVILLPFFFGATALSVAFATRTAAIGRLYAANLFGSALGAGVSLALLQVALPEQILTWMAFIAGAASLPARPRRRTLAVAAAATLAGIWLAPELPRSPYKPLSYALQLPEARRDGPWPHPLGRVDLVTSSAQRYAPDLSLRYTGAVPAPPHLFVDGDGAGQLLSRTDPAASILAETPRALPFAAGSVGRALFLSPGGTPYPNLAAFHGASTTVVEPHPRIAALMMPLLDPAHVVLRRADPRLFLEQGEFPPQDLIVFPERGMFGGPVGLQTLGEDNLFTVEALRTAWKRLAPDGRLAFSVWLDAPLRHAPRVVDLVGRTLRAEGIALPGDHASIVRGWGSLTLVVGRTPLEPEACSAIASFAVQKGFDVLWPPGPAARVHGSDDTLDRLLAALLGPDPEPALRAYRFDVRAPTDDRPFFNQFLRWGERDAGLDFLSVSERGLVFLQSLVALLCVAVLVLVLGPLVPLRASPLRTPFTVLYFTGLGAGFIFLEIELIQRLTLLWSNPILSASLVIAALMCGMGAGSAASHRFPATPRVLALLALGIAILQAALLVVPGLAVPSLLAASTAVRFGGGLAFLVLCAIPLGLPFPLGLRLLADRAPRQVPWACGIDGTWAVIAAPGAALIAFMAGFSSLALAAAASYLLAALGTVAAGRGR